MVKMNFTDDQTAFEYALYMMAASYFKKTTCVSQLLERKMLLQFKEQKLNTQYQMEEICIEFMDNLAKTLPAGFFRQDMEVQLNKRNAAGLTEIIFMNEKSAITFKGKYAGKKSQIEYQIWGKRGTGK